MKRFEQVTPAGLWLIPFVLAAAGCGADGTGGGDTNPSGDTLADPVPVACADQVILALDLQPTVAPGLITNADTGSAWDTDVDARAGGFGANPPDAYVYGSFTDSGLSKVAIDDESALESMDWDIAFRRYIIRINSGDSGPSAVVAFRMPNGTTFDAVDAVPASAEFYPDDDFSPTCTIINDGSGLDPSPATALSGFWSYSSCLQMTGNVYLIELRSGRHLKLEVLHYYKASAQAQCQSSPGTFQSMGAESGSIGVRWAFLD